jgi:hypothetical protein
VGGKNKKLSVLLVEKSERWSTFEALLEEEGVGVGKKE